MLEDTLNALVNSYYQRKKKLDSDKKEIDELNSTIKKGLVELGIDEFEGELYTVSRSIVNTDKLDEDKLIEKIHSILPEEIQKQVIQTKEILDLDKLEDLVYNRVIEADVVNDCIIHKEPTIRLNIKKTKKEEK